jgi:hypothetical protein
LPAAEAASLLIPSIPHDLFNSYGRSAGQQPWRLVRS